MVGLDGAIASIHFLPRMCLSPELRLCNQTQFTWSFKKNRFEEANIYLLQQDA